jgi:DNA repair exonuclease SbcCD ATPase subunit
MADLEQELAKVRQQVEQSHTRCRESTAVKRRPHDGADAQALSALEQEREALETELELVRNHAAELNETVAQQQREIAAQKSELGTELQQLRRLVEKQADLIADRAVSARENIPVVGQSSTVPTPPNDPVVNSVMAQFAKLQKDVAQRRRRKA